MRTSRGSLKGEYLLAIDQGTSGTSASLFDAAGTRVATKDVPVRRVFPQPGWVEQDPAELIGSIRQAAMELIRGVEIRPGQIVAMGLANQGECLLLWDSLTGQPVYNLIGWQCTRSVPLIRHLQRAGEDEAFRACTGLTLSAEWPATKIRWVLENVPGVRDLSMSGRLAFSQSDSWFMRHLTNNRDVATDHSTASRSGLYALRDRGWDAGLQEVFCAGDLLLPTILDSADEFGIVDFGNGWRIPWRGNALDQAAALLGQGCTQPGDLKITYGTCAGLWYNIGGRRAARKVLDTSIAWQVGPEPTLAVSGETTSSGDSIAWLREELGVRWEDDELSEIAKTAKGDELTFVTAFHGLGAPHMIPEARAVVWGLTPATGIPDLVRACLEAIAFSVCDLVDTLERVESLPIGDEIRVDGGAATNEFLMQFQADILGKSILAPQDPEGTSAGMAFLAGLQSGWYESISEVREWRRPGTRFDPRMPAQQADERYARWRKAVAQTADFYRPI